jgi:hypothetical protein
MHYSTPLNLTGMNRKERKAYLDWLRAEEDNIRRARNPTRQREAAIYHNKLNTLCNLLLSKKD